MLEVGDRVKLVYSSANAIDETKRDVKSEKIGKVFYIHNNYITIQFEEYKGTMQVNDILADKQKEVNVWILYKRIEDEWVEVKEEDLTTELYTEKNIKIKGRLAKWVW